MIWWNPARLLNDGLQRIGFENASRNVSNPNSELRQMAGGNPFGMNQDEATTEARNRLLAMGSAGAMRTNQANQDSRTLNQYQIPLADRLTALAEGRGPSAAQLQMQDALARAGSAQSSLARGAANRGVGAGAAFRQAANQTAALQAQGARDAGLMRVQEQLGANQLLGGVAQGMRQSGEQMNQFNAEQMNRMRMQDQLARIQALSGAAGTGTTSPGLGMQALAMLPGLLTA